MVLYFRDSREVARALSDHELKEKIKLVEGLYTRGSLVLEDKGKLIFELLKILKEEEHQRRRRDADPHCSHEIDDDCKRENPFPQVNSQSDVPSCLTMEIEENNGHSAKIPYHIQISMLRQRSNLRNKKDSCQALHSNGSRPRKAQTTCHHGDEDEDEDGTQFEKTESEIIETVNAAPPFSSPPVSSPPFSSPPISSPPFSSLSEGTATATSVSSGKGSHRKRTRAIDDEGEEKLYEHLSRMTSSIRELGVASSKQTQKKFVDDLFQAVMNVDGYDELELSRAFDYLVEHEMTAIAFLVKSPRLKKFWVQSFLAK